MPYGYSDPSAISPLLNKYNLANNSFADVSILNYIAGIDCRNKANNDYLPQYLTIILSIVTLLLIFLVHVKKNHLKRKRNVYVSVASKKLVSIQILTIFQVAVYLLADNFASTPMILTVFQFFQGFSSAAVFWFTDVFFF